MRAKLGNIQSVRLSDIEPTPYNATVIIRGNVQWIEGVISAGGTYPKPTLASFRGKLYPIGNLETLEAGRNLRVASLECVVEGAKSMNEVAELHITHTKSRTYNPISLMGIITNLEEGGHKLDSIPRELKNIHRLSLDDSVKERIDSFMRYMGENSTEVPSIMHILHPLSKIESGSQRDAMNNIIKYSTKFKKFIPPDVGLVNALLSNYNARKPSEKKVTVQEIKTDLAGEPDVLEADDDVSVQVRKNPPSMGVQLGTVEKALQHSCDCGRRYMVNTNTGKIKELKDADGSVTAIETRFGSVYGLSGRDSEFLELELSPVIYTYRVGTGSTGNVVVLSKKRLAKKLMGKFSELVGE